MNPSEEKTIYTITDRELQVLQQRIQGCQCSEKLALIIWMMFIIVNIARSNEDMDLKILAAIKNQNTQRHLNPKEALIVAIITLTAVVLLGVGGMVLSS